MGGAVAVVDVEPVRGRADHDDLRAGGAERLGRAAGGRTVCAVQDDLEPVQPVREGLQEVEDVAVLGVREDAHAAHVRALGPSRRHALEVADDLVLLRVGQLLAAAREELDAVVRGRVVGGGDHHAEVGVQVPHEIGGGGGRQHARIPHVHAGGRQARLHGGRDELTADARVPGHDGDRASAGVEGLRAEDGRGGLGQLDGQLHGEGLVGQATDAIGSEQSRHDQSV